MLGHDEASSTRRSKCDVKAAHPRFANSSFLGEGDDGSLDRPRPLLSPQRDCRKSGSSVPRLLLREGFMVDTALSTRFPNLLASKRVGVGCIPRWTLCCVPRACSYEAGDLDRGGMDVYFHCLEFYVRVLVEAGDLEAWRRILGSSAHNQEA